MPYGVLLVDDEPSVICALEKSIQWEKYGSFVAGTAENGDAAIVAIQTLHPDIVITDIRMNQTGGLELCQFITQHYKDIQIIIMSGYAEFSYAQKAINYGVLGYCLKPLEYDELSRYLNHAVQRLNVMRLPISRDDLLEAVQNDEPEKICLFLKNYGFTKEKTNLTIAVCDVPMESQQGQLVCIPLGKRVFAYLSPKPLPLVHMQQIANETTSFCCCDSPVCFADLPTTITKYGIAAFHYFIDPSKKITVGLQQGNPSPLLRKLSGAAAVGGQNDLIRLLQAVLNSDYTQTMTVQAALKINNIIFSCPFLTVYDEDAFLHSVEQMVEKYGSFAHMLNCILALLLQTDSKPNHTDLTNSVFIQMMMFINSNYNQNISLQQIAEKLHLNANYLSQAFKKETGYNFSSYLTQLRIEKSKSLLDCGNYTIAQAAAAVGFNDYFYFLKTFKKTTGKTPKQYLLGQ